MLGDRLIARDDAVVGLAADVVSDRDQFVEAVARGDHGAALALYRGPFLDGIVLPGGDEFEEWAAAERARLEDALVRVVDEALRSEPSRIAASARRQLAAQLLARAPDSVPARLLTVELLHEAGDRVAARREAEALEALVARDGQPLPAAARSLLTQVRAAEDAAHDPDDGIALEMVGRDEPFALATAAWSRARRGDPEGLVFVGVAGVGKTRLLQAIADRCARRGARILLVRAHPGEQRFGWSLLSSVVRALVALPGAAGISSESAAELVRLDPGLAATFPKVARAVTTDDGEMLRRRALALLDLLQAVADEQAIGLFLDDLHWADEPSRSALAFALARVTSVPLLVLATVRPGHAALDRLDYPTVALPPLADEAVLEAVRSSGSWPAGANVEAFLQTLATACAGIPLQVMDRLTLAVETGVLTHAHGRWSAPDWGQATRAIAHASPLAYRLRSCTDDERDVLLTLTAAGAPVITELFTASDREALRLLETKGLVREEQGHWLPAHDAVVEQLLVDSDPTSLREAHGALAERWRRSTLANRHVFVVRHLIAAQRDEAAGAAFTELVQRARGRQERRPVHRLFADIAGDLPPERAARIVAQVPWIDRVDRARAYPRLAALLLVLGLTFGGWWLQRRPPALLLLQASLTDTPASAYSEGAIRFVPAPIVQVPPSPLRGGARPPVRVRVIEGRSLVLAGASAVPDDSGYARFSSLRLLPRDSAVRLQFEADGYRPVTMAKPFVGRSQSAAPMLEMHLLEGRFTDGQRNWFVRGDSARLEAPAGTALRGVMQLQYSSHYALAVLWLGITPSWGDPRTSGWEALQLTTPARLEVVDVPVSVALPSTPGRYWLMLVAGPEPSGGYLLSATNWIVGAPRWDDGNEIATLPDAVVRSARLRGVLDMQIAFPDTLHIAGCERRGPPGLTYCPAQRTLRAVEVVVR